MISDKTAELTSSTTAGVLRKDLPLFVQQTKPNDNEVTKHREERKTKAEREAGMEGTCPVHLIAMMLALVVLVAGALTSPAMSQSLPGCPSKCGDVDVPYPFGINEVRCARDKSFLLTCNTTYNPPKLYAAGVEGKTNNFDPPDIHAVGVEITEVSLLHGFARSALLLTPNCFDQQENRLTFYTKTVADLNGTAFTIAAGRNIFVVTGCDTKAYVEDSIQAETWTGCSTGCRTLDEIRNGECSGFGCCQTVMPKALKYMVVEIGSFYSHRKIWRFNPCGYAFVIETEKFSFNTTLIDADYSGRDVRKPVVLDWAIEGANCSTAVRENPNYACRSTDSVCVNSPNQLGYLCNCSDGYQGNPYIAGSCQDINECELPNVYPCNGNCENIAGDYICRCPSGSRSNDPKKERCVADRKFPLALKLVIGLGCGFTFLLIISSWTYFLLQKKKAAQLKQKFFQQNGGLFLQQYISSNKTTGFKIFSMAEMKRATNEFDGNNILGKGGHGIVYKGILDDERIVAIKRSMTVSESESKEFAKEMAVLSQINHINVVKILGCCLEVEIPLLVYECIPNGTLFQYIHEKRLQLSISLSTRLRIATEVAEALSYLHSAASPPILHGDVKSSNILLDENYTAKVTDFGTSILAPNDETQFTTLVQGTCGYLDPEYLQTCKLTEKSDVYSFGVVLVELLTGMKALYFDEAKEGKSAILKFISYMTSDKLLDILDPQVVTDGLSKQLLDASNLAMHCLRLTGQDRPTMKEVLRELINISRPKEHPWVVNVEEASDNLLGETSTFYTANASNFDESLESKRLLNIQSGR